jgi:hypothetical protein
MFSPLLFIKIKVLDKICQYYLKSPKNIVGINCIV